MKQSRRMNAVSKTFIPDVNPCGKTKNICRIMQETIMNPKLEKYLRFYETKLGGVITEKELEYVAKFFKDCSNVLSVGCGPAVLEGKLATIFPEMNIVGIDNSKKMLSVASIKTVLGKGEKMGFKDSTFDCILFLSSLEFIDDYQKAVKEAFRVLKQNGKILILMLNPESCYFQKEYNEQNSYIRKNIKHTNIKNIENFVSHYFSLKTEYFLGIKNEKIFDSNDTPFASLYVMKGVKKLK